MSFENRYSWVDRLLHRIAFKTGQLQVSIADIEDRIYSKRLQAITVDRPVFVTALPRAGTTVLLNLLVNSGAFASHTYRDMPFVICPMVWRNFARHFYVSDVEQERAHGDGLKISADSPETFEEIIWKLFWPDHYMSDRIEPWREAGDVGFVEFMHSHVRKIVAVRDGDPCNRYRRYTSKNNLNIARIECMRDVFSDCIIIVPFRDPLQHAASLLKQHVRFLEMHKQDAFARQYMESIGHYDFGETLRPVNFDDWLSEVREIDATRLSFWIKYWIACYRHILSVQGDHIKLLSYAALTQCPLQTLDVLGSMTGFDDPSRLTAQAPTLMSPRMHEVDVSGVARDILKSATEIYEELLERSVVYPKIER